MFSKKNVPENDHVKLTEKCWSNNKYLSI